MGGNHQLASLARKRHTGAALGSISALGAGTNIHNVMALPGIFGLVVQMTPRAYAASTAITSLGWYTRMIAPPDNRTERPLSAPCARGGWRRIYR
jgi:hypothetical protein